MDLHWGLEPVTSVLPTQGITLPSDLRSALMNLNIAQYVNTIGPGL